MKTLNSPFNMQWTVHNTIRGVTGGSHFLSLNLQQSLKWLKNHAHLIKNKILSVALAMLKMKKKFKKQETTCKLEATRVTLVNVK